MGTCGLVTYGQQATLEQVRDDATANPEVSQEPINPAGGSRTAIPHWPGFPAHPEVIFRHWLRIAGTAGSTIAVGRSLLGRLPRDVRHSVDGGPGGHQSWVRLASG
jgi:hypothetical protein